MRAGNCLVGLEEHWKGWGEGQEGQWRKGRGSDRFPWAGERDVCLPSLVICNPDDSDIPDLEMGAGRLGRATKEIGGAITKAAQEAWGVIRFLVKNQPQEVTVPRSRAGGDPGQAKLV